MQFDWSAIWPAIPLLIEGAKMTLWISVLGLAGGLVIGLLAGFARTFGGWIANHVALVFIEVIRGTPIVVQVMFIYFALPMAFNDLRIDPFTAAVVTIMINSGAYIAEITRGAVLSILQESIAEQGALRDASESDVEASLDRLNRWNNNRNGEDPVAIRKALQECMQHNFFITSSICAIVIPFLASSAETLIPEIPCRALKSTFSISIVTFSCA